MRTKLSSLNELIRYLNSGGVSMKLGGPWPPNIFDFFKLYISFLKFLIILKKN